MTPKTTHLLADFLADCVHEQMAGSPTEAMAGATWEDYYKEHQIELFHDQDDANMLLIMVDNDELYKVTVTRMKVKRETNITLPPLAPPLRL